MDIGGDYYDLIHIDDKHIGLAIADVSGKGIGGATHDGRLPQRHPCEC